MSGWINNYAQLLRDPRWQKKRLQIMERDNWTCVECAATEKTFNVHHKIYRKGAKPWEYEDCDLVCLCEDCHLSVTRTTRELKESLATLGADDLERVLGYVKGLNIVNQAFDDAVPSPEPNAVRSAGEFEGMSDALSFGFDAYVQLCNSDTSEADLRAAYLKGQFLPARLIKPPRYEAS